MLVLAIGLCKILAQNDFRNFQILSSVLIVFVLCSNNVHSYIQ